MLLKYNEEMKKLLSPTEKHESLINYDETKVYSNKKKILRGNKLALLNEGLIKRN